MESEKIIYGPNSSFSHRIIREKYFSRSLHTHPEIEILLVTEGYGKRFVRDGIDTFYPGDLVMIGEDVPHFHRSDKIYYLPNELYCEADVIQFKRNLLPEQLDQIYDFGHVADLLQRSRYGIKFTMPSPIEKLQRLFSMTDRSTGIKRINTLLRLLDILGQVKSYRLLSQPPAAPIRSEQPAEGIVGHTYSFLLKHFKENISLEAIARSVHQNPTSLCRYFKRNTQKTIFECLNELRVEYVCRLLAHTDLTIAQAAYESGFRNLSHFNSQFRAIMQQAPSEYRRSVQSREEGI